MIAMLFPGHGSEIARMGLELAEVDERAAALLEFAGRRGDFSATRILRRGGDALSNTRILQPLMTAVTLAISEALARAGVRPRVALGHSLGELAAWSALGGLDTELAIELAAERGGLLAERAREHEGAMLALPLLDEPNLAMALAEGRAHGQIDVALHNTPGHWVLAGDRRALVRVIERVGGRFIAASGAWHCSHMQAAAPEFRAALDALPPFGATPGLILNHDGQLLGARGRAELIDALVGQLTGTVRFTTAMATLAALAPSELIIVGPGKLMRSLLRRGYGGPLRVHSAERPRDIQAIVEMLGHRASAGASA